jgi:hypothetical protein
MVSVLYLAELPIKKERTPASLANSLMPFSFLPLSQPFCLDASLPCPCLHALHIVHHYLIPEVRAVGYKFLVYRVVLVGLLVGQAIEEHKLRRMVAIIHHVPFFRGSRDANVKPADDFNLPEALQAGE